MRTPSRAIVAGSDAGTRALRSKLDLGQITTSAAVPVPRSARYARRLRCISGGASSDTITMKSKSLSGPASPLASEPNK